MSMDAVVKSGPEEADFWTALTPGRYSGEVRSTERWLRLENSGKVSLSYRI